MDRNILVVDIEATCWDTKEEQIKNTSEIIEIGWYQMNLKTLTQEKRGFLLVKPEISVVSPFCTKLTSLTQADIDTGMSFNDACTWLENNVDSKKGIWASYGDYDRIMFEKQCRRQGVPYPFLSHHINVKDLVLLACGKSHGMAGALKEFGLTLEGTHHRGVDDALNIAKILAVLIKRIRT